MKNLLILVFIISIPLFCHGAIKGHYSNANKVNDNFQNGVGTMRNKHETLRTNDYLIVDEIGRLTLSLLDSIYSRIERNCNIALSSISVWTILALLLEGSGGKTENELKKKLGLINYDPKEARTTIRNVYAELIKKLQSNGSNEFSIMNFVIADNRRYVRSEFGKIIGSYYNGLIFYADISEKEEISMLINNYVNQISMTKIQTIITPDNLKRLEMVIGSALYFKSEWLYPFSPFDTTNMPFKDDVGRVIGDELMMKQILVLPHGYNFNLEVEFLEIPYADNETSIIIMLPNGTVPLSKVLGKMKNLSIHEILPKDLIEERMLLVMPRFHIISKFNMNKVLKHELPSVFSSRTAEFPLIEKNISVSKLIHQVEIKTVEKEIMYSEYPEIHKTIWVILYWKFSLNYEIF